MRHVMDLKRPPGNDTSSLDSHGYPTDPVETVASGIWASIEPLSASERERFAHLETVVSHKISCYYSSDVSALLTDPSLYFERISDNRKFYVVSAINANERDARIDCACREAI